MKNKLIIFFLALFFGLVHINAQNSYEGKVISSIEVEVSGPPTVGKSYIKQNLQVEEKGIYRTTSIDKSIRNLIESGSIKDVKVFIDPKKSNKEGLAVVFKVLTKPRIEKIIFSGNDELNDKKLIKTITSQVGELYDESEVKSDQKLISELYLEKGFWNSNVNYQIIPPETDPAKIILQFDLEENDARKIRKIIFSGNELLSDEELLDFMETAPWRFWRFWSARSKYRPGVLEDDLDQISQNYRNEGFLDVKVDRGNISIAQIGKKRIDLTIKIDEGSRSYFGKQTIFGQAVLDRETLMEETLIKQGEPYHQLYSLRKEDELKGYMEMKDI